MSSVSAVLPAAADLSLDRARALERYTHGLLQPLVDLLREREAAVESRDDLIRAQAERIGRLERELELLRAHPEALAQAETSTSAPPPAPVPSRAPPPLAGGNDDLPQHVTSLASQVGRLRAELQLIASALQGEDEPAEVADEHGANERPASEPPAPAPQPLPAAAVSVEEMAGLFPAASRGRLTLQPLDAGAHRPVAPDPFAEAEAAVSELRRALAPDTVGQSVAAHAQSGTGNAAGNGAARHEPPVPPASVSPMPAALAPNRPAEDKPRRWWWPW
ncbi:MAG TPA: hypothetical protein VFN74_21980 [Chloroflexota bacterium]|nr:hypothetical protein [Chloroflexota bacterium]